MKQLLKKIHTSELLCYTVGITYIAMLGYMSYYNHIKEMKRLRDIEYNKRKYL